MSEYNIHFHMQEKIMKRLPVESLIRFRSVSKAWKSLIDSSRFITAHNHHRHTHPYHLLVSNNVSDDYYVADVVRFLSFIDDDTFPQQLSVSTVPLSVRQFFGVHVVGSSHGLICVRGYDRNLKKTMLVVWNPSIKKSVVVPVSEPHSSLFGFGVCPATGDPKLLLIKDPWYGPKFTTVYTLSSGIWRSTTMPYGDWCRTITTKKFIYLHSTQQKIVSFDLSHETFEAIDLPDGLTSHQEFYMSKIRESLAIIISRGTMFGRGAMFAVWMLEDDDVQRSFTNLFNIITPSINDCILGSRKNGILIMLRAKGDDDDIVADDDDEPPDLVVYEPNSGQINVIEIDGLTYEVDVQTNVIEIDKLAYDVDVQTYEETLLLLHCNSD